MTDHAFTWWRVTDYGTAIAYPDTTEVRASVDSGERGWYGTIEGAIIHGGVRATAFKRETTQVFDAAHWLKTGEHKPSGYVTITTITAEAAP
jgi:hypothetical protein